MTAVATKKTGRPSLWTPERDQFLRTHYPAKGAKHCAAFLGTSETAIMVRCSKLGIKRLGRKFRTKNPSGPVADEVITVAQAVDATYAGAVRPMASLEESDLWARYINGGRKDAAVRNQLLQPHLKSLHALAHRINWRTPGCVDFDDLVQVGWFGMVGAASKFEPSQGNQFWTYALRRVVGAMQDFMRTNDHVPRSVRLVEKRIKSQRDALARKIGRPPTNAELEAAGANIAAARVRGIESLNTVVAYTDSGKPVTAADMMVDEALQCERNPDAETDHCFREVLRSLSMREQTIVWLYHVEKVTMKQIGEVMHLSESRISQMMSRLYEQIRQRMSSDEAFALLRT